MDKETASTELYRVIISGGGTGGHIFPALSIADEIRRRFPKCDIQFVGAEGRAEAKRVPAAGYPIHLLPVRGLSSGGGLKRLFSLVPFTTQLYKSTKQAQDFVHHFDPQVVVGVGGYASAPTLIAANHFGIPVVVQEQILMPARPISWWQKRRSASAPPIPICAVSSPTPPRSC